MGRACAMTKDLIGSSGPKKRPMSVRVAAQ